MADFENVQPDEYKLLGRNFTPGRPWGITGVTIHHMAGDLDADGCNRVWRGAGTSAHYSVDRNGKIVQHVNDTDRAWACGDGVGVNSGGTKPLHLHRARQLQERPVAGPRRRNRERGVTSWRLCAGTTSSGAPSG